MAKVPRKSQPLLNEEVPLRSRARKASDPKQPKLLIDPMPLRIEPCKPVLKLTPPRGNQWAYEIKWDGYRVALYVDHSNVRGEKRRKISRSPAAFFTRLLPWLFKWLIL